MSDKAKTNNMYLEIPMYVDMPGADVFARTVVDDDAGNYDVETINVCRAYLYQKSKIDVLEALLAAPIEKPKKGK